MPGCLAAQAAPSVQDALQHLTTVLQSKHVSFFSSRGPSRLAIMTNLNACHGCTVTGVHSAMGDASLIIRQRNDQTLPNQHFQQRDKPQESKVLKDPNQIAVLRILNRPLSASFFTTSSIQLPMNNLRMHEQASDQKPSFPGLHIHHPRVAVPGVWVLSNNANAHVQVRRLT